MTAHATGATKHARHAAGAALAAGATALLYVGAQHLFEDTMLSCVLVGVLLANIAPLLAHHMAQGPVPVRHHRREHR